MNVAESINLQYKDIHRRILYCNKNVIQEKFILKKTEIYFNVFSLIFIVTKGIKGSLRCVIH